MAAHFVGFNKRNNFYLKHFSLKSIFHPLGCFARLCKKSLEKWLCPKNKNFFICRPILTYDSSFCRSQRKKQLLFQTFFSKMNISPIVAPHFACPVTDVPLLTPHFLYIWFIFWCNQTILFFISSIQLGELI